mmetsp:Transcript_39869/g.96209  ORF Transcript_39869/g.96209 Transcript_39869/m.96209 type:complete len:299 (-) Transcript_39869:831-1727(-)|eukprot:CAMPEP_0113622392 /NCGR_PEP_ID=MMETSP0017_2-20120614/11471_1 /TAXON_ID=2856 /ORGANISM="Cylindrotheca closterium" /LENGTH=298 /DNA_ID=CAMNT_0000532215 /DNA_START=50 /DNA_END=946 /DNA_ORIENTATION=- /assembly_acc=CAM_ASM_000147
MLSADDLQVRCSVRKAKNADTKEFSEPEDMTCTMRTWHGPKSQDAELLLKPVEQQRTMSAMRSRADELSPVVISKRFASFGEGRNHPKMEQQETTQNSIGSVKLSLAEIMIVEQKGQELDNPTIDITTLSSGYYEFTLNENGRAILLAFLKANLPKERIIRCNTQIQRTKSDVSKYSCSTMGNKTLDVEALTSNKLAERIENETMSEKLGSKVGRAFSSILEMVECSCISCGGSGSSVHPQPDADKKNKSKKALSPSDTKENQPKAKQRKTTDKKTGSSSLEDCGFSVESEPQMELVQ